MTDLLDDLQEPKAPTEPDPGPGKQLCQLLAREGKLDALLAVLLAEQAFWEQQLRSLIRERLFVDPETQAKAIALQGRLSAYASLHGKLRAWGASPKKGS